MTRQAHDYRREVPDPNGIFDYPGRMKELFAAMMQTSEVCRNFISKNDKDLSNFYIPDQYVIIMMSQITAYEYIAQKIKDIFPTNIINPQGNNIILESKISEFNKNLAEISATTDKLYENNLAIAKEILGVFAFYLYREFRVKQLIEICSIGNEPEKVDEFIFDYVKGDPSTLRAFVNTIKEELEYAPDDLKTKL